MRIADADPSAPVRIFGWGPRQWLLIAAGFHLGLSLLLYVASMNNWFPPMTTGDGRWAFAPDAGEPVAVASRIATLARQGQWQAAWEELTPWYSGSAGKFYALGCLLFGPTFVSTIPLNTLVYLLLLSIVYRLGVLLWDRRTGFWAAGLVALWPSGLMHLTQPLKDPPYLLGQFLFLYGAALLAGRNGGAKRVVASALLALGGFGLIGLVRPQLLIIDLVVWTAAAGVVILRSFRRLGTLVLAWGVALLVWAVFANGVGATLGSPWRDGRVARSIMPPPQAASPPAAPPSAEPALTQNRASQPQPLPQPIAGLTEWMTRILLRRRQEWRAGYEDSRSNVDLDVPFDTLADAIRHVPRALQVGFLAPFPTMWFEPGRQVGWIGRLVAGVEMIVMYGLLPLALMGFWRRRREAAVWLLALYVLTGVTLLGLVVTNVGALFRMRYVFWFVLFLPAMHGVLWLKDRWGKWRTVPRTDAPGSSPQEPLLSVPDETHV